MSDGAGGASRATSGTAARFDALAASHAPDALGDALQDLAARLVAGGNGREAVKEDLTRLMLRLREEGDEPREDAVAEVLDVLGGWCPPSARI